MKWISLLVLSLLFACLLCNCGTARERVAAQYSFEGNPRDGSGKGHDAVGDSLAFTGGKQGQAFRSTGEGLGVDSNPDLQIAPGLTIDCWVYFDERPSGYALLVMKDNEYQLRVDDQGEGGRFSFFVHLEDGWEPRASSIVAEAGIWYHLVAKWTGAEVTLTVNDRTTTTPRTGTSKPTRSPLLIAKTPCRLDELKLSFARQ